VGSEMCIRDRAQAFKPEESLFGSSASFVAAAFLGRQLYLECGGPAAAFRPAAPNTGHSERSRPTFFPRLLLQTRRPAQRGISLTSSLAVP